MSDNNTGGLEIDDPLMARAKVAVEIARGFDSYSLDRTWDIIDPALSSTVHELAFRVLRLYADKRRATQYIGAFAQDPGVYARSDAPPESVNAFETVTIRI